jgi:antitoxin (DNA-binding transcriptional repressor) of toxin-antitoxin stability system
MKRITLAELSQHLQEHLTEVQQTGEPLTVTRDDIPIAIINPVIKSKRPPFGFGRGTGKIIGDIVEPVLEPEVWEVNQ